MQNLCLGFTLLSVTTLFLRHLNERQEQHIQSYTYRYVDIHWYTYTHAHTHTRARAQNLNQRLQERQERLVVLQNAVLDLWGRVQVCRGTRHDIRAKCIIITLHV